MRAFLKNFGVLRKILGVFSKKLNSAEGVWQGEGMGDWETEVYWIYVPPSEFEAHLQKNRPNLTVLNSYLQKFFSYLQTFDSHLQKTGQIMMGLSPTFKKTAKHEGFEFPPLEDGWKREH
jgi:hypothetical protein